jgi:hypothetical protein
MRKKLFLLSFVLMFGLASSANGEAWVNWGADNAWTTALNWNPAVPTALTDAEIDGDFYVGGVIGMSAAPVIDDTMTADCKYLIVGSSTANANAAELLMTGGVLNVHDRVYVADSANKGAVGRIIMQHGTINMLASDPKLYVGYKGGGPSTSKGYLEISGGTINNVGKFYVAGENSGSDRGWGRVDMSGGTINVDVGSDRVRIGGKGGDGYLYMSGGTIICTDDFGINDEDAGGGYGLLHMTGGYISTVDSFRINYKSQSDSVGQVNLYGGIIEAGKFSINASAVTAGGTGAMDITYGTMILSGDKVSAVQAYEDSGELTAYGGVGDAYKLPHRVGQDHRKRGNS